MLVSTAWVSLPTLPTFLLDSTTLFCLQPLQGGRLLPCTTGAILSESMDSSFLHANLLRYSNTSRIPSVTLTDIGYYTDDGAYYYVWEAFNIPARPWPAEVGLLLVKEQLYKMGVPVAYMQVRTQTTTQCPHYTISLMTGGTMDLFTSVSQVSVCSSNKYFRQCQGKFRKQAPAKHSLEFRPWSTGMLATLHVCFPLDCLRSQTSSTFHCNSIRHFGATSTKLHTT